MQNGNNVRHLFGWDDHRRSEWHHAGTYPAFRLSRWYRVRRSVAKWLRKLAEKVNP